MPAYTHFFKQHFVLKKEISRSAVKYLKTEKFKTAANTTIFGIDLKTV